MLPLERVCEAHFCCAEHDYEVMASARASAHPPEGLSWETKFSMIEKNAANGNSYPVCDTSAQSFIVPVQFFHFSFNFFLWKAPSAAAPLPPYPTEAHPRPPSDIRESARSLPLCTS